jgi:CRP/FNR family transcriptional regulator
MARSVPFEVLAKCALFIGLPQEQLAELASIAQVKTYQPKEIIFADGERAEGFFVIVSGQVKIYKLSPDGREQILHIYGVGEPFAEVALFAGARYPAFAESLSSSQLLFFPKEKFLALISQNPQLSLNMIALLALRLRRFASLVEELSLKDVTARLAKYLLNLACDLRVTKESGATIPLDITKGELAKRLGTVKETLSRTFARLEQQQVIEVKGRLIVIRDFQRLQGLSEGSKV